MNPYRILFIKPHTEVKFESIDIPLGILYLSAYAKKKLGSRVSTELVDLRLEKDVKKAMLAALEKTSPHLIGISLMTFNHHFLDRYAGWLKEHAPGAKIVIGGPDVTYSYELLLNRNRDVDGAVIGEGEVTFYNLVKTLMTGGDIRGIRGIACHDGEAVICNEPQAYINDLDELPLPDYGLLRMEKYWCPFYEMNGVLAEKRHIHIISSRACPYHCIYCHNIFGKKVRRRSPENFVAEIQWLHDTYGIKEFHIVDDIFNIDRQRMQAILNRIIDSRMTIKLAFPNGLRADILEKEDLVLLKKAGAYMVTFAVETASPRMQKIIRKNLNLEKTLDNIAFASRIGLLVKAFFMLGFPGETPEEIRLTISTAVKSKLDLAHFFTVTPFPGTLLAELAETTYPGWNTSGNYHYWSARPFYQQATGFNLSRAQKLAYIKFYASPRILKTFLKVPRKMNRLGKWAAFAFRLLWD
jgi:radical SAM superfamily enzyme YgiQ (UPF0313 family)